MNIDGIKELFSIECPELITIPDQAEPLAAVIDRLKHGLLSDLPQHQVYYDESEDPTDDPNFDISDAYNINRDINTDIAERQESLRNKKNSSSEELRGKEVAQETGNTAQNSSEQESSKLLDNLELTDRKLFFVLCLPSLEKRCPPTNGVYV